MVTIQVTAHVAWHPQLRTRHVPDCTFHYLAGTG